jgi:hypothetical protein
MRRHGLTWLDIADKSDVPVATLTTQAARGWPGRFVRAAVEAGLDRAVFCTRRDFEKRKTEQARLGLCPVRATRKELFKLARRLGVPDPTHLPNRRTLLSELLARAPARKGVS